MPTDFPDIFAFIETMPHIDIEKVRSGTFITLAVIAFLLLSFIVYFLFVSRTKKTAIMSDLFLSLFTLAASAWAAYFAFFSKFQSVARDITFASIVEAAKFSGVVFLAAIVAIHIVVSIAGKLIGSKVDKARGRV